MAQLLITGGAGFIGSHACLVLLEAGHRLVVLDNFSNSSESVPARVAELSGISKGQRLRIIHGDIRNREDLDLAFNAYTDGITAVLHFAGLKAVAESIKDPLLYWDVNVNGSRSLLQAMRSYGCRTIVFSSSATVYGHPDQMPIPESAKVKPINPYGKTKAAVEQLLNDVAESEPGWRIARLRYFNPVGAHPSGLIGEDPKGVPTNLFPFISQVAIGKLEKLKIWGGDWPTPDGSCIRDYIHVMDLAEGHKAALDVLLMGNSQILTLNLGSGLGYSVLEVVAAFSRASTKSIPYIISERRVGDAACTVADPALASKILNWQTKRNLEQICKDCWKWQEKYPHGYVQN